MQTVDDAPDGQAIAFFQIHGIMGKIAGGFLRNKAVHHAAQDPLPVHPTLLTDGVALQDLHGGLCGHGCGGSQRFVLAHRHLHDELIERGMGLCKCTIAVCQRKNRAVARLPLNGGKLRRLLVVQRRQAHLSEQRVHALDMGIERSRFDAQLFCQRPHGKGGHSISFDKLF